jgi:phosphoserine/homoserine phosphotransferase
MAYRVAAAGDSYNDIAMLTEADYGVFFRPPENVCVDYPNIPRTTSYPELKAAFEDAKRQFG